MDLLANVIDRFRAVCRPRRAAGKGVSRCSAGRSAYRRLPRLELLEQRTLLSVMTLLDDSPQEGVPVPVMVQLDPALGSQIPAEKAKTTDIGVDSAGSNQGAAALPPVAATPAAECANAVPNSLEPALPTLLAADGNPPAPSGSQIIFTDDFEHGFPTGNWTRFGTPTWDDTTYRSHSPTHSAYCVGDSIPAPGPYPDDTYSWMIWGPFSLADATEADADFYYWNRSESGYDYFAWTASTDGQSFYGYGVSGDQSGWRPQNFDLTGVPVLGNLCGQNQVWIAWVFSADFSITYEGAYVDDVVISEQRANQPNLTPYQPSGWSDKIVVSKQPGTHSDDTPLYTTDTLYVDWAVINNGSVATGAPFSTDLYVDGLFAQSWVTPPPLDPGVYTYAADFNWRIFAAGTHTLQIRTDVTGAIDEIDEGDNTYTKTINVLAAPTGEIHGTAWNDSDGDSSWDGREPGLAERKIYIDQNANGQWDSGESYQVTDSNGNYAFTALATGTYIIGQVPQNGWRQTCPGEGEQSAGPSTEITPDELRAGSVVPFIADVGPVPTGDTSPTVATATPQSAVMLDEVPTSTWTYGCSATSAGMLFGYYDRHGYPDLYTGPTNGGVAPLHDLGQGDDPAHPIPGACSIIATQKGFDGRTTPGHVDDYWISYGSTGPDPWEGHRVEHSWAECTADFMGTNQWKWDTDQNGQRDALSDGGTFFFANGDGTRLYDPLSPIDWGRPQTEGCHGMRLFAESRGYTVVENYTQAIDTLASNGFSFANLRAEIDAGHPVLTHMFGPPGGHSVVIVGYNAGSNTIYIHDTWGNDVHTMTWGGDYAGMTQALVTVIHLAPSGSYVVTLSEGEVVRRDFGNTHGARLCQWGSSVVGFSTQYTNTAWSAAQALGAPSVPAYGDNALAWAPWPKNGTSEWISVAYATPVYADQVTVRETWGNGFVVKVEVHNAATPGWQQGWQQVWTGADPTAPGTMADFVVPFAQRNYLVDAVRVTINTNHSLGTWEEIDAVQLCGFLPPVGPEIDVPGIPDGDTAPTAAKGSDFGAVDITSGTVTHTFTIHNLGDVVLNLTGRPPVQIVGPQAADFSVVVQPSSPVPAHGSVTFQVQFAPSAMGLRTATVRFASNDEDNRDGVENPYDFALEGLGGPPIISQWASSVIDFSSQYSSGSWAALQALGPPDVPAYGDNPHAWAPLPRNGTSEWISLGYTTPVYASAVTIRETWGNGFVTKVQVRDALTSAWEQVWAETDPTPQGNTADFTVSFTPTTYLVDAVKVSVNTNHSPSTWEEIDAVQLRGIQPPLLPEAVVLGGGIVIADDDRLPRPEDGTDFGNVNVTDATATHTFTIRNLGSLPLNLTGTPVVQIVGANAADFTVVAQPITPVPGGTSVTFEVRFDPSAAGLRTATVQIANDDADNGDGVEDPYDFAIQGKGGPPPVQWASSVIAASSEYISSPGPWSAAQALGPPNVPVFSDHPAAWAPRPANGTIEWIALGYTTPVHANGVTIRETWGNGFVIKVEVRNASMPTLWEQVWAGLDPTLPYVLGDFVVSFPETLYLVDAVRVTIDTNHSFTWEEIDAVQLRGGSGSGSAAAMLGTSHAGTASFSDDLVSPSAPPQQTSPEDWSRLLDALAAARYAQLDLRFHGRQTDRAQEESGLKAVDAAFTWEDRWA